MTQHCEPISLSQTHEGECHKRGQESNRDAWQETLPLSDARVERAAD